MARNLKTLAFCLLPFAFCLRPLPAAALPDNIGAWQRTAVDAVTQPDQALWKEYGFQIGETATYRSGDKEFTATAWRLQDATGALGVFEWQRPPTSKPSPLAKLAAETDTGLMLVHHNYLLSFEGYKPGNDELAALAGSLKNLDGAPLPTLPDALPTQDLVPNSERYIAGPIALERFAPGISPATAGFHLGAEAQVASYRAPAGEMKLAIFIYPTAQIAIQRIAEFQKIPQVMAKRTGPMIAVVLATPDANAAERLLSLVRYQGNITLTEYVYTRRDNIGDLVTNAFVLIGLLLAFATVAGLAFGGFRYLRRKRGIDPEAMITLHLADR